MRFKAVSQSLWPDKDREEWFSLGENHEKIFGFGLHQLRNRCRALLPALVLFACGATWAQSPTYGVGRTPTPEEIRTEDITISPDGKNLPPGKGTAKEGAATYAQKCAMCHGPNGSGGLAPMLIKPETPVKSSTPCLEPCIGPR